MQVPCSLSPAGATVLDTLCSFQKSQFSGKKEKVRAKPKASNKNDSLSIKNLLMEESKIHMHIPHTKHNPGQLAVTEDEWNRMQSPERLYQRTLQNSTDTFYWGRGWWEGPVFPRKSLSLLKWSFNLKILAKGFQNPNRENNYWASLNAFPNEH